MINVKDYRIEISRISEEDGGGYIAYIPELNCIGDGSTVEEAIKDVYEVAEDIIAIAKEDGNAIPEPQLYKDLGDYSGKLSLRLPKTLHRLLAQRAKDEECSINQLILSYVSMGVGDAFGRDYSQWLRMQEADAEQIRSAYYFAKKTWSQEESQVGSHRSYPFTTIRGVSGYGKQI